MRNSNENKPNEISLNDALVDLEIRYSHHEVAIDELQRVIFDQHKTIEKLEKALTRLTARFEAATDGGNNQTAVDEKPPHY